MKANIPATTLKMLFNDDFDDYVHQPKCAYCFNNNFGVKSRLIVSVCEYELSAVFHKYCNRSILRKVSRFVKMQGCSREY